MPATAKYPLPLRACALHSGTMARQCLITVGGGAGYLELATALLQRMRLASAEGGNWEAEGEAA